MSQPRVSIFGIDEIYPVTYGGQKAVYHFYGEVNKLWPCQYVFLDPAHDGVEEGTYPNGLGYLRIGGRAARSPVNSLLAHKLVYRDGRARALLRTARTKSIGREFSKVCAASIILVFAFPWLWHVVKPYAHGKFVVYDSHNFELRLVRDRLEAGQIDKRSLGFMRETECGLSLRADLVLACSSIDVASYVSEFGVDAAKFRLGFKGADVPKAVQRHPIGTPPTAIFVGSNWPPNNEAASVIAERLAPRMPHVHFKIIGSCCKALPQQLPPNVTAAGFVQDLDHELTAADIALNPISMGSGINMKLLEYLAWGVPVVSTEFGARGLEPAALEAVQTSSVDEFPAAIEALLNSPQRRLNMSAQGHAYAQQNLDWAVIAKRFVTALPPAVDA